MASRRRTLRMIYIVIGIAVLAYALYAHLLISGLLLLLLIVGGVLLVLKGISIR